ncbi:hypothetical protein KA005_29145, partial [bacterium]|nr:hypothetical protein [bacterium]
ETPKDYLGRVGMNAAASLFVTSHEIGHLLLGHIEKDPNPNLEYEADAFATLIVGMSRWINKEFAIASVFALIDIIEADNPQSAFHPNSLKRFGNVIAQTNEMKAEIDWGYVGNLLKSVLDKSAVSRVGRRVFEDISELRTNCQGEK